MPKNDFQEGSSMHRRCRTDRTPGGRIRRALLSAACLLAGSLGVGAGAQAALPVIPNAAGFGMETPAGRGGTVYRVTNLNASGAGSLKACVDASGPRVCVFEVSGTIRMNSELVIRNPYLTIAGQTAPSPGIMLRGAGIRIKASDVLLQHLRVRVGDDPSGPDPENRDALMIDVPSSERPISNIVIDHCSFSWAIDETASVWGGWDNVTFRNSIFAEPLNESLHPKGAHGYGIIFGPRDARISMIGNLMAHTVSRNPLSNATRLVMVNNVIYNWKNMAIDLQGQQSKPTHNSLVGNVFVRGPDYRSNKPISLRAGNNRLPAGSKVFVLDNHAEEATDDPWSVVGPLQGSFSTSEMNGFRAANPLTWPSGMTAMPTSQEVALNAILARVGARPADRDSVDARIIEQVKTRTGQIINCVSPNGTARCNKNAGGWPKLAENQRPLELPANPNQVTESGYTNLELWLHKMAAEVEGRSGITPHAPVLTTSAH